MKIILYHNVCYNLKDYYKYYKNILKLFIFILFILFIYILFIYIYIYI